MLPDQKKNKKENPDTATETNDIDKAVAAAHEQADADIAQDPDLSIHSPNDDLDEGETARLGEGKNDLI